MDSRGRAQLDVIILTNSPVIKSVSTERHTIDVLVTPHPHPGETGGAAGVSKIDGVGAAFASHAPAGAAIAE